MSSQGPNTRALAGIRAGHLRRYGPAAPCDRPGCPWCNPAAHAHLERGLEVPEADLEHLARMAAARDAAGLPILGRQARRAFALYPDPPRVPYLGPAAERPSDRRAALARARAALEVSGTL